MSPMMGHGLDHFLKILFSLPGLKRIVVSLIIHLKYEPYYLNLVRFIDCIYLIKNKV